ncbi:alpha/beta hydrolase, partial [candidate division WOR_3 bacterium SM1_77]
SVLDDNADLPVTLVGYSWGAWLSFIIAARYPSLVKKLILVSSGPFEAKYAGSIMKTRLDRLGDEERKEVLSITEALNDLDNEKGNMTIGRFGQLISKVDSFNPVPHKDEVLEVRYRIFKSVWNDAEKLRSSGRLLQLAEQIQCPVTALHGDYDPHPAEGVEKPLSKRLNDFRFMLLKNCGHTPWIERQARDEFFRILAEELKT